MLPTKEELKSYSVYRYEHIDDEMFCTPAVDSFGDLSERYRRNDFYFAMGSITKMFFDAGWEGDGSIGVWWLPPFLRKDPDTYSRPVFHVKQCNNGTSYLAIPNDAILPQAEYLHKCSA